MAVTADALLVADRLIEGHAQRDADVLDRVVRIDMQIALGLDVQVDQAMPGNLVEHVVQKRHTRLECRPARAVQVHPDPDPGF